jgi:hypothetical protein
VDTCHRQGGCRKGVLPAPYQTVSRGASTTIHRGK